MYNLIIYASHIIQYFSLRGLDQTFNYGGRCLSLMIEHVLQNQKIPGLGHNPLFTFLGIGSNEYSGMDF